MTLTSCMGATVPPTTMFVKEVRVVGSLARSVRSRPEHVFVLTTNQKGGIAETKIAAAETELGISVLRPIVEHGRYDLAFEIGERILKVQCKWGSVTRAGAVVQVSLQTSSLSNS